MASGLHSGQARTIAATLAAKPPPVAEATRLPPGDMNDPTIRAIKVESAASVAKFHHSIGYTRSLEDGGNVWPTSPMTKSTITNVAPATAHCRGAHQRSCATETWIQSHTRVICRDDMAGI